MSRIQPKAYQLKTGQTIIIRSASPADAQGVLRLAHAEIAESEFSITTPEEFHPTIEQEVEWIQSHTNDAGRVIIVAETDGQLIGLLNFQNSYRKRLAHQGEFGIGVRKEWRNQGVGRVLLQTLIAWGEANPIIEKLCLEVFSNNERAIHLYSSLGFQVEGRLARQVKMDQGKYLDLIAMGRFVK